MRKSTKLALAFVALAGAVGSTAYAEGSAGGERTQDGMTARVSKAMEGAEGAIGFDQFSTVMDGRLKRLASNNGGRLTVADIAEALETSRYG